jgi:hypothetical protein
MKKGRFGKTVAVLLGVTFLGSQAQAAGEGVDILRQGLLGAGVGAISAEVSGGKAGKGALIGAGTQVIGTALIGLLTGPSTPAQTYSQPVYTQPAYSQPTYYQPQPQVYVQQQAQAVYTTSYRYEPVYVSQAPAYSSYRPARRGRSQQDSNRQILRQGLLGAGVGAISAEASGGKAGQGALIGAGTNVIGGALLELLTSS